MELPTYIKTAMKILSESNYESYVVGGCVRDTLLGITPDDWDMCTSALPEQVIECFKGRYNVIETGLKHGTVTVIIEGNCVEITTYRSENSYSDGRHPDKVIFHKDIKYDLSRRDFTINAMAYNDEKGLIDPFSGSQDLRLRIVKAVGNPYQRFNEDSLRILRALRFASKLNFSICKETSDAIHDLYQNLSNISAERINKELQKFIDGKIYNLSQEYADVLCFIIPEFKRCIYQEQGNNHSLDVYKHMMFATDCSHKHDISLALFLHDVGKPKCAITEQGSVHFPVHNKVSADMANSIMKRFKFSNQEIETTCKLIEGHCEKVVDISDYSMKVLLNKYGYDILQKIIEMQRCDVCAKLNPCISIYMDKNREAQEHLERIIQSGEPYNIKMLDIRGDDITPLFNVTPGPWVKETLEFLLDKVMQGKVENKKKSLINYLESLI